MRADGTAEGRTYADAPEVDGKVVIRGAGSLSPGTFAEVRISGADAFDLHAAIPAPRGPARPISPRTPGGRRAHRVISRV